MYFYFICTNYIILAHIILQKYSSSLICHTIIFVLNIFAPLACPKWSSFKKIFFHVHIIFDKPMATLIFPCDMVDNDIDINCALVVLINYLTFKWMLINVVIDFNIIWIMGTSLVKAIPPLIITCFLASKTYFILLKCIL